MNSQTSARNETKKTKILAVCSQSGAIIEALDLAHHLRGSRPRFIENLCEEFRLAYSV
jgi:hypothetical protein